MKQILCGACIFLALLLFTSAVTAEGVVPDLVGTWTVAFNEGDTSSTKYVNASMNTNNTFKIVIETQNGPIFEGYRETLSGDKSLDKEGLSGVISDDMTRAYIKQYRDGISFVDIISPDTMTVYSLYSIDPRGKENPGVARVELVRETST